VRALPTDDDYAEAERAYRRAKWKLVFHCVFVAACCVPAVLMRRFFRMPPALLGVVFIVALIVFGGDIMNFIRCRDRLRRLQVDN
jgi:hypothetical protein